MSAESREEFWSRWLPKAALPRTEKRKQYKEGQVWAVCCFGHDSEVARVDSVGGFVSVTRLAGYDSKGWAMTSMRNQQSVLVQDVGEAEPRPPSVLFTPMRPGYWPTVCLRCAGKNPTAFACTECWEDHRAECSKLGDAWTKHRRLPAIAATQLRCGQCHVVGGHSARCPEEPAPTTGPAVVSPTRQHDLSDPYCAGRNRSDGPVVRACKACGAVKNSGPCVPNPEWRTKYEATLAASTNQHRRIQNVGDLQRSFDDQDARRAAALASLGGYPGRQRDVSGVGAVTNGIWNVAPERGR